MATGMNQSDRALLNTVLDVLRAANAADTQHEAMSDLLWAKHLLETLLRKMQDS